MKNIDRNILKQKLQEEDERFIREHPESGCLFEKAKHSLYDGVPMNWMIRWAGAYPVFVKEAKGNHFTDVDGKDYIDFCLGDTGAMTGHAPDGSIDAITDRIRKGTTFMLPTEDAIFVGEELQKRFGLPYWQVALTATDANRFAVRIARHITGRKKILVFNWCYHGSVDETIITINDGVPGPRPGHIGEAVDPVLTTRVVEFNDIPALEEALAHEDVACVLAEPALTNIGIVHPKPDFHNALRELTRKHNTLLIIDETHTVCTGPGGYTREFGLSPDMITLGKPIGSGIPGAVYGFSEEVGQRYGRLREPQYADIGGIGGTLAGNALTLAAMRATFENVLTEDAYRRMISLAELFTDGLSRTIKEFELPWIVERLGCRAEYWFCSKPPENGGQAAAATDDELDRYMHLASLNRGILMTPFHNMALIAPSVIEEDIHRHTTVFREIVQNIMS